MFKLSGNLITATVLAGGLITSAQALDYWTGGAGMEARENAPTEQNTAIEFFVREGSYLAEVWVTLYDEDGSVLLETMTEGPWLVVDLEPGEYSVRGERASTGEVQSARFQVSGDDAQLIGLRYIED